MTKSYRSLLCADNSGSGSEFLVASVWVYCFRGLSAQPKKTAWGNLSVYTRKDKKNSPPDSYFLSRPTEGDICTVSSSIRSWLAASWEPPRDYTTAEPHESATERICVAVFVRLKIPAHQPETLETPRQTGGGVWGRRERKRRKRQSNILEAVGSGMTTGHEEKGKQSGWWWRVSG